MRRRSLWVPALLASFAVVPVGQGEFPPANVWTRVSPSVVWCGDSTSAVRIEVHIVGRNDVAHVGITNGSEADQIALYDDGSHGDSVAWDNVFTAEWVQLRCYPTSLKYGNSVGTWWGFLRVTLKDGTKLMSNYGVAVGVVHPRFKDVFEVVDLGHGLSATAYAFFINDSQHEVLSSYPVAEVTCGKGNYMAYRKLYSVLPDAFDFALVTPGFQLLRPDGRENVPYMVGVSNAIRFIGLPVFDQTALFGSTGRLKSAIYHSFGSIAIVDHEVAHTWGASVGVSLGLVEEKSKGRFHWSSLSDIGGQLGAYYFSDDGKVGHFAYSGDGTWRLIPNTEVEPYSPMELYIMGLIPPEDVPPIHILTSPDLRDPSRITAASVRTVTIADILWAEGVRQPTAAESQKQFTLAYIVTQDGPYDAAAYAYFSLLSYALMRQGAPEARDSYAPFFWATGGRATLSTRLPLEVLEPEGLPSLK